MRTKRITIPRNELINFTDESSLYERLKELGFDITKTIHWYDDIETNTRVLIQEVDDK